MKRLFLLICLAMASLDGFAQDIYEQALNTNGRSSEDKADDTKRKPSAVLRFFDIKPDQKVLDLFSGGGYYTEIASHIVGDSGRVDAHNNNAYINYIGKEKLLKRYDNNRLPNVKQLHQEANDLALCNQCYDRILMVLTFHDLFYVDDKNGWPKIEAAKLMQEVRSSLKKDGIIGIVDHNAAKGSGIETAQSTHRIDPQLIKDHMQKWGFKLHAESDALANPKDDYALPMWDPKVKRQTDRAIMKFTL